MNDKYKPVPLNLKKEVARAMRRPGFKAAWDALEEETTTLAAVLEARKQSGLTQEQRAQLADKLLSSLSPDAEIEEAWSAEAIRRLGEMENGSVSGVPGEEAIARARRAIR